MNNKIEEIPPNQDLILLVNRILDQNQQIIEQNNRILEENARILTLLESPKYISKYVENSLPVSEMSKHFRK